MNKDPEIASDISLIFLISPSSTQPIASASDTAFWTKLNWKSTCKSGANLRLIVNSKSVIMGSANFNTDDLLNAVSDDKGLRRVSFLVFLIDIYLMCFFASNISVRTFSLPCFKKNNFHSNR